MQITGLPEELEPEMEEQLVLQAGKPLQPKQAEFIRGPIPVMWLNQAAKTCPAGGYVGVLCWHLARLRQEPFTISKRDWERFGVCSWTGRRALNKLMDIGLITIDKHDGQCGRVRINRPGAMQ